MTERSWFRWTASAAILATVALWSFREGASAREERVPRRRAAAAAKAKLIASTATADVSAPLAQNAMPSAISTEAARTALLARPVPESLRRLGASTVAEAIAVVEQLPESEDRSTLLQGLLEFCLSIDAGAAAHVADGLREAKLREHGVAFVLVRWAEADAPSALHWAAVHPKGENDGSRFYAAYEGFAAKHPAEALRFFQRAELQPDTDALARIVVYHFSDQDRLSDVRVAIEQMPSNPARVALTAAFLAGWSKRSPEEAATWLASHATTPGFADGMGTIVRTVAASEPSFAAGLAVRFPDGRDGRDLLADVIQLWTQTDLGGAAEWLRSQPPRRANDAAVVRLIEAVAPHDRVEARQWIARIVDPALRAQLIERHEALSPAAG